MNDRPNPRPDMIFIEALAALPDTAIITFGHNFTTASMMRCVRAEKNRAAVTPYLRLVETVQEMDREQFSPNYLCAACLCPFRSHPGEAAEDYDLRRGMP
jgi:hypothetical protein